MNTKTRRREDDTTGPEMFHTYPNGDQAYFVCVVYRTMDVSGELRVSPEGAELRYFAVDELPAELAPANRPILERYAEGRCGDRGQRGCAW